MFSRHDILLYNTFIELTSPAGSGFVVDGGAISMLTSGELSGFSCGCGDGSLPLQADNIDIEVNISNMIDMSFFMFS